MTISRKPISRKPISLNKDWNTPIEYVEVIKNFFLGKIYLDPCSNEFSLVNAEIEYKLPKNGLEESWNYPTIYVNPPYGRDKDSKTSIKTWIDKCREAHQKFNSEVIALIPVATNTKHWQENIFLTASAVCFLQVARLKFLCNGEVYNKGAPMACCLVYWGNNCNDFRKYFSSFGKVMEING